jgi:hypothetical protein
VKEKRISSEKYRYKYSKALKKEEIHRAWSEKLFFHLKMYYQSAKTQEMYMQALIREYSKPLPKEVHLKNGVRTIFYAIVQVPEEKIREQ